jgi:lysophospholipase L1-like esterase
MNLIGVAAAVIVVEGRGGISYLKSRFFPERSKANVDVFAITREKMFESYEAPPAPEGRPIIFLGDSITAQCEWFELFGRRLDIINRGINGDTTAGVLKRISNVSSLHPSAVFLMIGTNDPERGFEPFEAIRNYRMIVGAMVQASPDVRIFAESILSSRASKFNRWRETVNSGIRQLADGKSVTFVDLRPAFLDDDHLLNKRYTYDGLHLNGDGYKLWKRQIDPIVKQLAERSTGSAKWITR